MYRANSFSNNPALKRSIQPQRWPQNPNLSLHWTNHYRGLPVVKKRLPLVTEFLERALITIHKALEEHPRLLAVRVDLRFPDGYCPPDGTYSNKYLQDFWDALRGSINYHHRRKHAPRVHPTTLRYIWAREYREDEKVPHFHLFILLNRDAYYGLGRVYSDQPNLLSRIQQAWQSALGGVWEEMWPTVHIPDDPYHRLNRGNEEEFREAFRRASYLCKAETKLPQLDKMHPFGTSRT